MNIWEIIKFSLFVLSCVGFVISGTTYYWFSVIEQEAHIVPKLSHFNFTRALVEDEAGFRAQLVPVNDLAISEKYPTYVYCWFVPGNSTWQCYVDGVNPEYEFVYIGRACVYEQCGGRADKVFAYKHEDYNSSIIINHCQFQYNLTRIVPDGNHTIHGVDDIEFLIHRKENTIM